MAKPIITQEYLKSQLHYNPETGIFNWIVRRSGIRWNKPAGHLHSSGYVNINLLGTKWRANQLAFLYMTGRLVKITDHINRIKNDNRWLNLRECNTAENMQNTIKHKNNTSGFKGVDFVKSKQQWRARCRAYGKRFNLGLFETAELAHECYKEFAKKHHGEFYAT
jgi:branched-subunit amino acid aminotransferase/4-amino-4-deoxychorismate lyase